MATRYNPFLAATQSPPGSIFDAPNPNTVTAQLSQAIKNEDKTPPKPNKNPPKANLKPGAAQNTDDNYGANTVSVVNAELDGADITPGKIEPKPNVLDQYASYTYTIGWYIITPEQFNALAVSNPNFDTWSLLVQSGGSAPPNQKNTTKNSNQPVGGRNQYFSNDFYIDNLTIKSQLTGKGTHSAHAVGDLDFNIYEPSGITLPNILAQATKTFYSQYQTTQKTSSANSNENLKPDYNNIIYALVIKFYGYDDEGNLWSAGKPGNQGVGIRTEQGLIVQKFIPFTMSELTFKISNKAVEYKISGAGLSYTLHASTQRASIPFNMHLTGKTLEQILNGNGSTGAQAVEGRQNTSTTNSKKQPPAAPAQETKPTSLPSIATGQDNPLLTPGGMDFTTGNF